MKCMSCQAEIPPSFVYALQINQCPGCSGKIMDDISIQLLTELKEAIVKMAEDPKGLAEGLAGWILSNYNVTKIGETVEPTNFHRKPIANSKKQSKQGPKLKIANNPVHDFLKRTNASKGLENRPDLRELVNTINSGNVDENLYGDDEELDQEENEIDNSEYSEDEDLDTSFENDDLDPYEEAETNRKNFRSIKNAAENNSLTLPGSPGQRPLSRKDQAEIAQAMNGGADLDAVAALNEARKSRLQKSRDVASGGGQGSFRRGG